jgi:hypothetical protein
MLLHGCRTDQVALDASKTGSLAPQRTSDHVPASLQLHYVVAGIQSKHWCFARGALVSWSRILRDLVPCLARNTSHMVLLQSFHYQYVSLTH